MSDNDEYVSSAEAMIPDNDDFDHDVDVPPCHPSFRERCMREATKDVIFLFQVKSGRSWVTDLVFLTREEGERHGLKTDYRYPGRWRVYGVPAEGELVDLIKGT